MKTKTKILISIPNTKRSNRFPNKNRLLVKYTVDWLDEELQNLPDNWDVKVIEIISDLTDSVTDYPICRVDTDIAENHREIINFVHNKFNPHIHIHLQLTNYNRRLGLIKDAVLALVMDEADVVTSYCKWYDYLSWRDLTDGMFHSEKRNEELKRYYDGGIYVFREPKQLFDYKCKWSFIFNKVSPIYDIDYKEELERYEQRHKIKN